MKKSNLTSKKIIYQLSSPWLVVFAVFLVSLILGYCIYLDLKIDGILFNDIYLYENQINNIIIITFVLIILSILFYVKIIIIDDDEIIICRMKFLFWIKPFILKIKDIHKLNICIDRVSYIVVSYLNHAYSSKSVTVISEKTFYFMGLRKKSLNNLVFLLDDLGVVVYEGFGNLKVKLPRDKYVKENKRILRG